MRWECAWYTGPLWFTKVHVDTPHEELVFVAAKVGELLGYCGGGLPLLGRVY